MVNDRFDFLEFGAEDQDNSEESSAKIYHDDPKPRYPNPPNRRESRSYEPVIPADESDSGPLSLYTTPPRPTSRKRVSSTGFIDIKPVEVFGSYGTGLGKFNSPGGIAVDMQGNLYIADVYNHRVQRITPDGGVSIIGTKGPGRLQFLGPSAVACDREGSFYVVEMGNNRVQKFRSDGTLDMVFGREGARNGEFHSPLGICINSENWEILVADTGNNRVQRFNRVGGYLGSLGAAGSIHPPLHSPQAVTCDRRGNIYVADSLAHRIARYDPLGRFMGYFGGVSNQSASFELVEPHALACDYQGELFFSDGVNDPGRIVAINLQNGQVRARVEQLGKQLGTLARPGGLALTTQLGIPYDPLQPNTQLYVADTLNHRIIRFSCAR